MKNFLNKTQIKIHIKSFKIFKTHTITLIKLYNLKYMQLLSLYLNLKKKMYNV